MHVCVLLCVYIFTHMYTHTHMYLYIQYRYIYKFYILIDVYGTCLLLYSVMYTYIQGDFSEKQHSLQNVQIHTRHVAHGTAAAERELNSMAFKILSNAEIPCNIICYVCLKTKKAFYYIMVTPHKRHYANERWIFVMNNNVTIVLLIEALIAE